MCGITNATNRMQDWGHAGAWSIIIAMIVWYCRRFGHFADVDMHWHGVTEVIARFVMLYSLYLGWTLVIVTLMWHVTLHDCNMVLRLHACAICFLVAYHIVSHVSCRFMAASSLPWDIPYQPPEHIVCHSMLQVDRSSSQHSPPWRTCWKRTTTRPQAILLIENLLEFGNEPPGSETEWCEAWCTH